MSTRPLPIRLLRTSSRVPANFRCPGTGRAYPSPFPKTPPPASPIEARTSFRSGSTPPIKLFERQLWATYKQWSELGAQVRKGEKGSLIVKYGEWVPKDSRADTEAGDSDGEESGKRLYAKAAYVFNVAQVDGFALEPPEPRPDLTTAACPRR